MYRLEQKHNKTTFLYPPPSLFASLYSFSTETPQVASLVEEMGKGFLHLKLVIFAATEVNGFFIKYKNVIKGLSNYYILILIVLTIIILLLFCFYKLSVIEQ